jgi:hypothetical protein
MSLRKRDEQKNARSIQRVFSFIGTAETMLILRFFSSAGMLACSVTT